jgi:hypothetical protein
LVDLSFRFDRPFAVTAYPTELAVLMAGVAARQAASVTARLQAQISRAMPLHGLMSPTHGAFSLPAATALTHWHQG